MHWNENVFLSLLMLENWEIVASRYKMNEKKFVLDVHHHCVANLICLFLYPVFDSNNGIIWSASVFSVAVSFCFCFFYFISNFFKFARSVFGLSGIYQHNNKNANNNNNNGRITKWIHGKWKQCDPIFGHKHLLNTAAVRLQMA